jgi:uncharacterized protein (TIRG00374 family)
LHILERIEGKKIIIKGLQILFPLVLGAVIMVWMYRDFDFGRVKDTLLHGMDYGWMLLSLVFGVTAQMFRGWRWRLSLDPLGEHPRRSRCVYAIFVSYAANLVVPRVGEISRCAILKRYDGVNVAKSLGTVVTERLVDSLCIVLFAAFTLLSETTVFRRFFRLTGTRTSDLATLLSSSDLYIIIICALATLALLYLLVRRLKVFTKVMSVLRDVWMGIASVGRMHRTGLYVVYTLGIWVSYFLHFWITYYAFSFTASLGMGAACVMFILGSFAVVVPTPNGAGPWHFVIITALALYGVDKVDAGIFALVVHTIQTLLILALGVYGLAALPLTKKSR